VKKKDKCDCHREAEVSKTCGLHGQAAQRSPITTKGTKDGNIAKVAAHELTVSRLRLAKTNLHSNPRPPPLMLMSKVEGAHTGTTNKIYKMSKLGHLLASVAWWSQQGFLCQSRI